MICTHLYDVIRKQCHDSDFLIILRKCFMNVCDHVNCLAIGHLSLDKTSSVLIDYLVRL